MLVGFALVSVRGIPFLEVPPMKTDSARFTMYFSEDARVAKDVKLNPKYTLRPSEHITGGVKI
jgi:hypothetical protein